LTTAATRYAPHSLLMPFAVLVLFNLLHLTGLKTFEPWFQVTAYWSGYQTLFNFINNFFFYRLAVASPGLWLEDLWPGHGFSVYASVFLFLSSLLFVRIQWIVSGCRPQIWAWALLVALFMLMNGRGTIGWAGWLMVVHACLSVSAKRRAGLSFTTVLQSTLGLILATVTSGIFICCIFVIGYFSFFHNATWPRLRHRTPLRWASLFCGVILLSITLYFAISYLTVAIERVLLFYGGGLDGFVGAATHGFLQEGQIEIGLPFIFIAVFFLNAAFLFLWSSYPHRIGTDVVMIILIALGTGAIFGLTILTLAFPLIFIATGKLVRFRFRTDATP